MGTSNINMREGFCKKLGKNLCAGVGVYPGYVLGEGQFPCFPRIFTLQSHRYDSGSIIMRKSSKQECGKQKGRNIKQKFFLPARFSRDTLDRKRCSCSASWAVKLEMQSVILCFLTSVFTFTFFLNLSCH